MPQDELDDWLRKEIHAMPHLPMQIGTHHPDGSRTFSMPGDVCDTCSDAAAGRWVPVSQCPEAIVRQDELDNWLRADGPRPAWT